VVAQLADQPLRPALALSTLALLAAAFLPVALMVFPIVTNLVTIIDLAARFLYTQHCRMMHAIELGELTQRETFTLDVLFRNLRQFSQHREASAFFSKRSFISLVR
jgi:hypothetical protein